MNACIKLIVSDNKDIYDITKDFYLIEKIFLTHLSFSVCSMSVGKRCIERRLSSLQSKGCV